MDSLNKICGTNYDLRKLKNTFYRFKSKFDSKYHSLLYNDPLDGGTNRVKEPMLAIVPPQFTTKKEPEVSLMSESSTSLENDDIHESHDSHEYVELSSSHEEEKNERENDFEDLESRASDNKESAMIEEDYNEELCGADDYAKDVDDVKLSSNPSEVAETIKDIEPGINKDHAIAPIEEEHEEDMTGSKTAGRAKFKHPTTTEKITLINIIKTLDVEGLLINATPGGYGDAESKEKRKAIWHQVLPAFNEICGTNWDMKKLRMTFFRIKSTPGSKYHPLIFDETNDEMSLPTTRRQPEYIIESPDEVNDDKHDTDSNIGNLKDKANKNNAKNKHMTKAEKITLINVIKSLDKECLLKNAEKLDSCTTAKRRAIWRQVVPALNEICGTNYDMKKLIWAFQRMKGTPGTKYFSLYHDHPPK